MTPPTSSTTQIPGLPPLSSNIASAPFHSDTQDENIHLQQNPPHHNSRAPTRGFARKHIETPSSELHTTTTSNQGPVVVGVGVTPTGGGNGSHNKNTSITSSSTGIVASAVKNIEYNTTKAGRNAQIEPSLGQIYSPRSKVGKSPASSPPTPRSNTSFDMREPVSVSNVVEHMHALTPRSSDGNNAHLMVGSREVEQGRAASEMLERPSTNNESSAMTTHGWRNSAEQNAIEAAMRPGIAATPPRHSQENAKRTVDKVSTRSSSPSMIPRNPRDTSSAQASPKYRARQQPQQTFQTQPQLQPLSRDSQSVQSQASSSVLLPPPSSDWQWGQRSDPDDQEQALFEQRLCEDFYGVAVRKINQNGKSNLRYVKCCLVDVSEIEGELAGGSSTRSISSRTSRSRGAFSRLRGDRDRSLDRSEPRDYDAHQNLIKKGRKKVLTWGKKKDVKIPLDRFVCVRKGKTNDRTRRNTSPASRILSLITDDPQHPSLDIEAPTKLDREKFARAFSRFLDVPLEGDDVQSVRSAEVPPITSKDQGQLRAGQVRHVSATHSEPDMDAIANHHNSNIKASRQPNQRVPLPVVTTTPTMDGNGGIRADSRRAGGRVSPTGAETLGRSAPSSSIAQMAMEAAGLDPNNLDVPDPQIGSLPSSTKTPTSGGRSKDGPKKSGRKSVMSPASGNDADESVVSSLSGAGYDQEIVEELHQALNDLRAELEESRAEAARAVKVAEQAIQSAENSNSRDWNSTVTHKAAEAAALAQKRSAEAMAKQRLAEERLEGERRNTSFWRKQAEAAEEEAGALQTRAAAAAVQRESMAEALESERRNGSIIVNSLKQRFSALEAQQREALTRSLEKNRSLELELEATRRQLEIKKGGSHVDGDNSGTSPRSRGSLGGRMKKPGVKESVSSVSSKGSGNSSLPANEIMQLYSELSSLRKEYSLMQKATVDELRSLPADAELWAQQASLAVQTSQQEIQRLRSKLAAESATRRKLLHEVQDLRGAVRVYCRPRASSGSPTVSMASNEVLLLHRDRAGSKDASNFPLSFEFDGIFRTDMGQQDVYDELEDVCLGVVDGYNICLMTYGQKGSGKTYSLLGDVKYSFQGKSDVEVIISDHGLHLRAMSQLFSVLSHRSERYQDVVTITIVEVDDERLCDMIAGTKIGETSGRVIVEDGRAGSRRGKTKRPEAPRDDVGGATKLEIKTDHNGETVVSGLLSVEISSMEDVHQLWQQCLAKRLSRLAEQGIDIDEHEGASHVITTVKVVSTNVSTGIGSTGKMQFVDLACSDVTPRHSSSGAKKSLAPDAMMSGVGNEFEWKFTNKSMTTLAEVVTARSQFVRSVPYRNSTLTHLLSDSLEADTKVIMVACISQDIKDLQATACTLRFASKMRKIVVGKATKHTLTHA